MPEPDHDPHRSVWFVCFDPSTGAILSTGRCRAEDVELQPGPRVEFDEDPGDLAGMRVDVAALTLVPTTLN